MNDPVEIFFSEGPKIKVDLSTLFQKEGRVFLSLSERFSVKFSLKDDPSCRPFLTWLEAYGQGKSLPSLAMGGQNFPLFTLRVLTALSSIPVGKTLSYGEIARQAGQAKASRAVGTICRRNRWALFIPCHRVLPKTGKLGGYAFGSDVKHALLTFEKTLQH